MDTLSVDCCDELLFELLDDWLPFGPLTNDGGHEDNDGMGDEAEGDGSGCLS